MARWPRKWRWDGERMEFWRSVVVSWSAQLSCGFVSFLKFSQWPNGVFWPIRWPCMYLSLVAEKTNEKWRENKCLKVCAELWDCIGLNWAELRLWQLVLSQSGQVNPSLSINNIYRFKRVFLNLVAYEGSLQVDGREISTFMETITVLLRDTDGIKIWWKTFLSSSANSPKVVELFSGILELLSFSTDVGDSKWFHKLHVFFIQVKLERVCMFFLYKLS